MGIIAAGPWYTDPVTVLTLVLVVLAILTIGITVYVWRVGTPRRRIIYDMPTAISLLPIHSEFITSGKVSVNFEKEHGDTFSVADPYLVTLTAESEGHRDISTKDFDNGRSLVFDLGAPIVTPLGKSLSEQAAALSDEVVTIGESTVEVSPCLIRKGPMLSVDLLLSGPPHLTDKNPLINVDVVSRNRTEVFGWKKGAGCLTTIAILLAGALLLTTWATSFGVNYYRTHSVEGYARTIHHWAHIEDVIYIAAAAVAAVGVVVAVLWSRRQTRKAD